MLVTSWPEPAAGWPWQGLSLPVPDGPYSRKPLRRDSRQRAKLCRTWPTSLDLRMRSTEGGAITLQGLAALGRPTCLYVCGWPDLYRRPAFLQHSSEMVCGSSGARVGLDGTVRCSHSLRDNNKGRYGAGSHYPGLYYPRVGTLLERNVGLVGPARVFITCAGGWLPRADHSLRILSPRASLSDSRCGAGGSTGARLWDCGKGIWR